MTEKIKWKKFDALVADIGRRPFLYNESSDCEFSEDFSFKSGELSGAILGELEIDSSAIIAEFFGGIKPTDHLLLHSTLGKIIDLDLFEHEGDDNFVQIVNEICDSIKSGYFIWKDVTCYDEADMCSLKFEPKKCTFFTVSNPYY